MPNVVLIRPGCTDFDEQNRVQGTLELPMNSRGLEQVEHVLDELREVPLEVIYAPPTEPAWSTAERLADELDVPLKECEDLRNLDQGLWQGLQIDEVRHKFPKVFKQWQELPETICPPQGETVGEALDRIRRALHKPLKRKTVFGVVASEPLATLVRFVVCGQRAEMPDPICSCGGAHVEYLQTDQPAAAAAALPAAVNGNGSAGGAGAPGRNGPSAPGEAAADGPIPAQGGQQP
ncbi:MAG TPA: histidine phosphatase family protein [Planctomycetaceae bacterium]|nr:histidine phosphatase family protein [Planctomycetaceae bacterium]